MFKAQLKRLVLIAVLLHVVVALGIFLVGRASVLPGVVDSRGLASFARDSRIYQMQATALEQTLKRDGVMAWLRTPAPVHVKLYSLSYAIFSPAVGQNILGAEPLNLLFYLSTLLLIFAVGREVFGASQGLLAAWMCLALLPSFLLHTTQLLKDPLFIVATLVLVLITVRWLTIEHKLTSGLIAGAIGGSAAASLWLIKNSAWWVVMAVIVLGAILSLALQAYRRTMMPGNLAGIALVIAIAIAASSFLTPYWLPREYWAPDNPGTNARISEESEALNNNRNSSAQTAAESAPESPQSQTYFSRVTDRVREARADFIKLYPEAGSNLDTDLQFNNAYDIFRYLPRAVLVGLCAPFPIMWFRAGENVGLAGRIVSGAETFVMYIVLLLAIQGIYHNRHRLPVYLIVSIALIGVTALGLVVVNVGALYRQRYLFWMLIVIVGADAAFRLLRARLPDRLISIGRRTVALEAPAKS